MTRWKVSKEAHAIYNENGTIAIMQLWGDGRLLPINLHEQIVRDHNRTEAFEAMRGVLQDIYSDMKRGHSINPYEHKANVGQALALAEATSKDIL